MPYGPYKTFLVYETKSGSGSWEVLETASQNGYQRETRYGPYNSRFEAEQKKRWLEEDFKKERGY